MKFQNFQENILPQTAFVRENAQHVFLNEAKLKEVAQDILSNPQQIVCEWTENDFEFHYTDGTPQTACWLFLSSALNFSFWDVVNGETCEPWHINFNGKNVEGYWGLTAALKKAMDKYPLLDADFLENMNEDILKDIFKGEGNVPLLEKRVQVCQNIGQTLNDKWGGSFENILKEANGSAVKLTNLVANTFDDFKDVSTYNAQQIPILKRAQILCADIAGAFKHQGIGHFHDFDKLTIFADYKLPQFLRALGVMEYSDQLAYKVDHLVQLPQGCPMEVEIRALTIQAVEELRKLCNNQFTTTQLDWWIWHASFSGQVKQQPHHLVRSVFY